MRLDGVGELDGTFGDAGTANVPVTALTSSNGSPGRDEGMAVALQPDGRIVVAGSTLGINPDFAIVRLLADGTLDTSFTDTGVLRIDLFRFTDLAENVAVTDRGDIIASGLARQNVDGYGLVRLTRLQG